MSFTQTPNYALYKPTVNADNDQWGTHLNANADTLDSTLKTIASAFNDTGRNLIHNPLFNVAQRGTGSFTVNGYTLDRWALAFANDTNSISLATLVDSQRAQVGDEAATYALSNTFAGNAAAGAFSIVRQSIEGVRRLAGKTVTVSFWAAAGSGAPRLGVSFDQLFGTGGSPSAVVIINGQSVALSTTWTRYSVSFVLPSASGKTLGTNGDDNTTLDIWYSSGSTNNIRSGSVGVQSGIISVWGVQLEIGSVATPLEKPDPRYDLSNCQRFYQVRQGMVVSGYVPSSTTIYAGTSIAQMRAVPTQVATNIVYTNANSLGITMTSNYIVVTVVGIAVGMVYASATFAFSADL